MMMSLTRSLQALGALVAAAAAVGIAEQGGNYPLNAYVFSLLESVLHSDTEAQA
jgi:hypothetical protein